MDRGRICRERGGVGRRLWQHADDARSHTHAAGHGAVVDLPGECECGDRVEHDDGDLRLGDPLRRHGPLHGVVYAGRNTGQVLAWKTAPCLRGSCPEIWSASVREPIVSSSPTVVDGRIYIGSADDLAPENQQGRLYVFALR